LVSDEPLRGELRMRICQERETPASRATASKVIETY